MKRFFITGTDTDCGKTYVTCQLLANTPNSVALKPVASGCEFIEGAWVSQDAKALQANTNLSLDDINPWRFKDPIAPHIAAAREGVLLSARQIADYCLEFQAPEAEVVFIEGAGGLMVPLNPTETWVDMLTLSKIPVIFVVGMKLGCINHALLSAKVMQMNHINCAGWIANPLANTMDAFEENLETLQQMMPFPLLRVRDVRSLS